MGSLLPTELLIADNGHQGEQIKRLSHYSCIAVLALISSRCREKHDNDYRMPPGLRA